MEKPEDKTDFRVNSQEHKKTVDWQRFVVRFLTQNSG